MSNIQIFRFKDNIVTELTLAPIGLERNLQKLIESKMETFLGVRFLATEYTTGKKHRGRIDSLGLDENNCPVIVEYKRHSDENIINQGLYYLDWLLDHRDEFRWLVMEKLGRDIADSVEWEGTRLLCIAADFTRYDQHAVQQIPRNIELLRYRVFDEDLLLLELINTQAAPEPTPQSTKPPLTNTDITTFKPKSKDKNFAEQLENAQAEIQDLYADIRSFTMMLGDDVTEKQLKLYVAFRKIKNFACVVIKQRKILLNLTLNPDTVVLESGFSRDIREKGTWGTGELQLTLCNFADFERAKPLLERAYHENQSG